MRLATGGAGRRSRCCSASASSWACSTRNFFTIGNLVRLLNTAAIPLVVCMGATFIILMGSIDLSVEGVVALCAVAASMLVANDFTGIAIGLLVRARSPSCSAAPWAC